MEKQVAEKFLPQKFPFQMIDYLHINNDLENSSSFTIKSDNVLVNESIFSAGGLLENMAQTVAASNGYFFSSKNKPVPVGYIGAIKKVIINQLPKVGDTIQTTISILNNIGNASIVEGKIFLKNDLIAQCELTIFVNN